MFIIMAFRLGDWKQVQDMQYYLTITWQGAKKREFLLAHKNNSTSQRLSMKVKSNVPCNLEMLIQQALIQALTSNMSLTKLTHNVFIVEKWAFFFLLNFVWPNKGHHLNQFNGPSIQHKVVLSYNLIRVVFIVFIAEAKFKKLERR